MKKLWIAVECAEPPEGATVNVSASYGGERYALPVLDVRPVAPPDFADMLRALAVRVHKANEKWWIDVHDGVTPLKRNKGELLALIHSEISEALEGERKDLMDDKLPHRKMAEVELADAIIRILDYSEGYGYDIGGAFEEKMAFNAQREDHTHEARKIAGGKQF